MDFFQPGQSSKVYQFDKIVNEYVSFFIYSSHKADPLRTELIEDAALNQQNCVILSFTNNKQGKLASTNEMKHTLRRVHCEAQSYYNKNQLSFHEMFKH